MTQLRHDAPTAADGHRRRPSIGPRAAAGCALALLMSGLPAAAAAGQAPAPPAGAQPPAVFSRDAKGEVTLHAIRATTPLSIDGRLDEPVYGTVDARAAFLQQEPHEGTPATEATDVWVLFDDKNLYVSARCWDSQPEREIATELRRDGSNVNSNENVAVSVDTLHDQRNGFFFQTTPLGAMRDQAIVGGDALDDWNGVWEVKSARFDHGWMFEMAIPFKTLRYSGAGPQVWGINVRRTVRWKNEISYITKVEALYGAQGISRMSLAATLVGVETPAQSVNLELKPYGVSSVTTDRAAPVPFSNDATASAGIDFKYGLTRSLIADATINTDFAQVEEDLQQVNLTRFSLFFPEKRDFFLEGQGIFGFGGIQFGNGGGNPGDVPVLFFSRRIGLSEGQAVPVRAGGRVTGKAGRLTIGALQVRTGDKAVAKAVATDFSVMRLKWDFLRRSNFGFLATRRAPTVGARGTNLAWGADATLRLLQTFNIFAYYAQTDSPGRVGGAASYRGRFEYGSDRYGFFAEHLTVGANFNPEVGYVRRSDVRHNFVQGRFSPRPRNSPHIRKYTWLGSYDYITDARQTMVQNKEGKGTFTIDFQNSDQLSAEYTTDYELLPRPFTISPGVVVPAGGYDYRTSRLSYTLGQQHKVSGKLSAATGSFYDGTKTEASYTGRLVPLTRFAVEPSLSFNWVDLPYGDFNAILLNSRFIVSPSARMLISSLVQYNAIAHSLSSSLRLRWEYTPGSELFVVYSDGRDTATRGIPDLLNRSFAVKLTRLVRF